MKLPIGQLHSHCKQECTQMSVRCAEITVKQYCKVLGILPWRAKSCCHQVSTRVRYTRKEVLAGKVADAVNSSQSIHHGALAMLALRETSRLAHCAVLVWSIMRHAARPTPLRSMANWWRRTALVVSLLGGHFDRKEAPIENFSKCSPA